MNVLRWRGHVAAVTFDAREGMLVGRVLGIDDQVCFHGQSVDVLKKAFGIAVREYEAGCKAFGRAPQRSHSGEIRLRMAASTHARAAMAAEARGISLNQWIGEAMRRTARLDLGDV